MDDNNNNFENISALTHLYRSICLSMRIRVHTMPTYHGLAWLGLPWLHCHQFRIQSIGYWFCVIIIMIIERMVLVRQQRSRVNHQHELSVLSLLACLLASCSMRYSLLRIPQFIIYARDKIKLFHTHPKHNLYLVELT